MAEERLRAAIAEAAGRYDLAKDEPKLLRHNENAVYAVMTADGKRALLRLHSPANEFSLDLFGAQTGGARVAGEMRLHRDLAAGSGVPAPVPCTGRDGELTQTLSDGTVASCVYWIDGDCLNNLPHTESLLREAGRSVGALRAFRQRDNSEPYDRIRYDESLLGRMREAFRTPAAAEAYGVADAHMLSETVDAIERHCRTLGKGPDAFGIVHSDLGPGNMVRMADGRVALIDFGLSGYGWRDIDVGSLHAQFPDEKEREWLADGYEAACGVRPTAQTGLPFLALNVMLFLVTHMASAKDSQDWLPQAMRRWERQHFRPTIESA